MVRSLGPADVVVDATLIVVEVVVLVGGCKLGCVLVSVVDVVYVVDLWLCDVEVEVEVEVEDEAGGVYQASTYRSLRYALCLGAAFMGRIRGRAATARSTWYSENSPSDRE